MSDGFYTRIPQDPVPRPAESPWRRTEAAMPEQDREVMFVYTDRSGRRTIHRGVFNGEMWDEEQGERVYVYHPNRVSHWCDPSDLLP